MCPSSVAEEMIVPDNPEIAPYTVHIDDADLSDLKFRLRNARWPYEIADRAWIRGVPLLYLKELVDYWRTQFEWRTQESTLNRLPQFTADIDGQTVHFLHIRSEQKDALPLVLTHGWPSCNLEFLKIIKLLSDSATENPTVEGGFHLVIPSLPGYGFSTPLQQPGWGNLFRVAGAWVQLMNRLAYTQFGVHGTDVGAGVANLLGMIAPDRVIGIHLTGTVAAMPFGPPISIEHLSETDRDRARRFNQFQSDGLGYLHLQATRPATLAYCINDSPVEQLAWIIEKFHEWTDPKRPLSESKDDWDLLLTIASIFWFRQGGTSSAHAVYEGMQAFRKMTKSVSREERQNAPFHPPTGVAVFAADTTIRAVMDPDESFIHWSEFDRGGHFPAIETPDLLAQDLRAFFEKCNR